MTQGTSASLKEDDCLWLLAIADEAYGWRVSFIAASITLGIIGCILEEPMDIRTYGAIIDVRTPSETSAGHLEGALLFDIYDETFMTQLATLDKSANYFVYCRSGSRSGQAINIMQQEGFTGILENGGSLEDAATETGLSVVQ